MNKASIKRIWQILMTVTVCCMVTACGGDDDKKDEPGTPDIPNKDLNYAKVNYSIELPQDVVDLWDVEIRYTDVNGETSVAHINAGTSWSMSVVWDTKSTPLESIPEKVSMSVVGKPKATPVTLDPDKKYTLGKDYNLSGQLRYNNGKSVPLGGGPDHSSYSVPGSKLTEAVKKDREILRGITFDIPHTFAE